MPSAIKPSTTLLARNERLEGLACRWRCTDVATTPGSSAQPPAATRRRTASARTGSGQRTVPVAPSPHGCAGRSRRSDRGSTRSRRHRASGSSSTGSRPGQQCPRRAVESRKHLTHKRSLPACARSSGCAGCRIVPGRPVERGDPHRRGRPDVQRTARISAGISGFPTEPRLSWRRGVGTTSSTTSLRTSAAGRRPAVPGCSSSGATGSTPSVHSAEASSRTPTSMPGSYASQGVPETCRHLRRG